MNILIILFFLSMITLAKVPLPSDQEATDAPSIFNRGIDSDIQRRLDEQERMEEEIESKEVRPKKVKPSEELRSQGLK